jgi:multiple antibiotic resistance protein
MPFDYLASALVTLFVVVDPIGIVPAFLALTERFSASARQRIAVRAVFIAGITLAAFALVGNWFLEKLGITLPAFRIAGGLLLFMVAFEMVLGQRTEREAASAERATEKRVPNIAAFPLAMPLIAGPGAITATLLLAGQAEAQPLRLGLLLAVIAIILSLCLAVFKLGNSIHRLFGTITTIVLSRILGVVLAALAVQYVIDGIREAFKM